MNCMLIKSSWHKVIYWVVFVQRLWQWLQSWSWPTAVCWMSTVRFGSEVATGWPLCEVGAAPCQTQLPSSGSNRATIGHSWVPQPRWWHLCDSYFRKDKQNFTEGEKGTKRVRKSRGNTKVRGAGVEALEGSGQSHSPWKITWWSRYCLQPMEDHTRADIHIAARGLPCAGAGVYFLKDLWPMESPY